MYLVGMRHGRRYCRPRVVRLNGSGRVLRPAAVRVIARPAPVPTPSVVTDFDLICDVPAHGNVATPAHEARTAAGTSRAESGEAAAASRRPTACHRQSTDEASATLASLTGIDAAAKRPQSPGLLRTDFGEARPTGLR